MITVNVRGDDVTEHILRRIAPRHAEALVKQTVGAIATKISKDARKSMYFSGPYSTGRMRKSVKNRRRRTRNGIVQTDIVVAKRAFYWRFYEYGDGDVRARRMFAKAVDNMRPRLVHEFKTIFGRKFVARLKKHRNGPLPGAR